MGNRERLSTPGSLSTSDVWQKSIGHDPYKGADEGQGNTLPEVGEINSSAKGLFRLAQLTGNSSTLAPGSCKRCGQVGHLYFNCRNYMMDRKREAQQAQMEEEEEDEPGSDEMESSDDDDDDSSDDSDEDSEDEDSSKSESESESSDD